MKKAIYLLLCLALALSVGGLSALADGEPTVFVTIANGELVLARENITVTDVDNDGALTLNDALYLAHEAKYDGGAAAGYGTATTEYGLGITKLWGVENGGSYGYCVNNVSANNLAYTIADGDSVCAYVYTDLTAWSDTYSFFASETAEGKAGEGIELVLTAAGYDENGNPIAFPLAGAKITLDGEDTGVVTGEDGKAVITVDKAGSYLISAVKDGTVLVPPVCCAVVTPAASTETAELFVTIANGELVLARENITVTDVDGDGALTINDALYLAHEAKYDGGAAAGYGTATTEYGLGITKLWGVENGGSYGYRVNNASANNLTDTIADGDSVCAYVYTDLTAWSDTYSFFASETAEGKAGEGIELVLTAAGYDENWNPVALPLAGAKITVDGEDTGVVTGEDGKAVITVDKAGSYLISAVKDGVVLVPPVCCAVVTPAAPPTGDTTNVWLYAVLGAVALAAIVVLAMVGKKHGKKS